MDNRSMPSRSSMRPPPVVQQNEAERLGVSSLKYFGAAGVLAVCLLLLGSEAMVAPYVGLPIALWCAVAGVVQGLRMLAGSAAAPGCEANVPTADPPPAPLGPNGDSSPTGTAGFVGRPPTVPRTGMAVAGAAKSASMLGTRV